MSVYVIPDDDDAQDCILDPNRVPADELEKIDAYRGDGNAEEEVGVGVADSEAVYGDMFSSNRRTCCDTDVGDAGTVSFHRTALSCQLFSRGSCARRSHARRRSSS